jgi:trk system potassium uptake protein TrkA
MKKIAVIGLSSFGLSVVRTLAEKDVEVIAVDKESGKTNKVKDAASRAVTMDATLLDNLVSMGIAEMDHVVVSTGPNLEPSIITVLLLKELGVKHIIAKALTSDHEKILLKLGVHEVAFPERDAGKKVAQRLIFNNLLDYFPVESGIVIEEIATPEGLAGKSLAETRLREKHNVTIIAVKSIIPDSTLINPDGGYVLKESDILIVLGSEKDIETLHEMFQ